MEERQSPKKPVLILGIGNILLRDEGVGVRAVEQLSGRPLPPEVELLDGGTSGANLVDEIADRRKVIVIDAMDAGAEPGTVFRADPEDLLDQSRASVSLHEFGLLDMLSMAEHLDCSPREVVIYGVQPGDVGSGLELSGPVQAVLERLTEHVLAEAMAPEDRH